jgi:hypothetical protein
MVGIDGPGYSGTNRSLASDPTTHRGNRAGGKGQRSAGRVAVSVGVDCVVYMFAADRHRRSASIE